VALLRLNGEKGSVPYILSKIYPLTLVISWFAFGDIRDIREGTIVTAIIMGPFIKLFSNGRDRTQQEADRKIK